ncbi:hypothetical protein SLE2022_035120 [Rubroshorea leprosula]
MFRFTVGDVPPRVLPMERLRRSASLALSPMEIMDGFSRNSFSYSRLPDEPIKLSVLKLDGSSFDVEVTKSATIADLKLAVQAVFSHVPNKISWSHVWGHFCLSYEGQKLVTDTDHIKNYGINDGDQLHFIRHISISCNPTKKQAKKREISSKQGYMSLPRSNVEYKQIYEEVNNYDDTENGNTSITTIR